MTVTLTHLSSTSTVGREEHGILLSWFKKTKQTDLDCEYPKKISFKNKGNIKTFLDKWEFLYQEIFPRGNSGGEAERQSSQAGDDVEGAAITRGGGSHVANAIRHWLCKTRKMPYAILKMEIIEKSESENRCEVVCCIFIAWKWGTYIGWLWILVSSVHVKTCREPLIVEACV